MPLPTRVDRGACAISELFALSPRLAQMLEGLDRWAQQKFRVGTMNVWPGLYIISGQRSAATNEAVGGAPNSRHLSCPSDAVDLRVGTVIGLESNEIWAILGGKWRLMGGRWGGEFSTPDPNHFDLGAGL